MASKFITAAILKSTPKINTSEEGGPLDPKVTAKWFSIIGDFRWYLTEYNPSTKEAFGFVTSSQCPEGELGYFDLGELENMKRGALPLVERDLYFTPCLLSEIKSGNTF